MNSHPQCSATLSHRYVLTCYNAHGHMKWHTVFTNLVTTEGLNAYLDATLKTGTASPVWYVGLVKAETTGFAAGDTLASHGGWTEAVPGTNYTGNRQAWTPGTIVSGSVHNTASKAIFPILSTMTIVGAFLTNAATGSTGILLGGGSLDQDRDVIAGDTVHVAVTCTMTSA